MSVRVEGFVQRIRFLVLSGLCDGEEHTRGLCCQGFAGGTRKQRWERRALYMDDQREKLTLCLLTDICSFKTPLLLSSPCLPKPTLLGIALKRVRETCKLYANAMVGKVMNIP